MNNAIARKIVLTASYQSLTATQTVATVTVSAPQSNIANAYLQGDTGNDVPIAPGEWFEFRSVDLASLQVKGTVGDILSVVGGTW